MYAKEFCAPLRPVAPIARPPRGAGYALALAFAALAALAAPPAPAQVAQNRCALAAQEAARVTGVPLDVLMAITLTETGRRQGGALRPWPWTVNMEGEGRWFATREAALAYVRARQAAGARSFDIGCFQLNHKWHGRAFASFEDMFDPVQNATYAARFLKRLHARKGNWELAAAAYHSATPVYAERYRKRFARILAGLQGAGTAPAAAPETAAAPSQGGAYPLLWRAARARATGGSLVFLAPAGSGGALISAAPGRLF